MKRIFTGCRLAGVVGLMMGISLQGAGAEEMRIDKDDGAQKVESGTEISL